MRTISLDARCHSVLTAEAGEMRTPSPSQSSLASLASGTASCINTPKPMGGARCLSPLLIPPRQQGAADPGLNAPASPLGTLQPDLYRVQEGPIYLTAPSTSHIMGRVHLRIRYDYHVFDLNVHLIEGKPSE